MELDVSLETTDEWVDGYMDNSRVESLLLAGASVAKFSQLPHDVGTKNDTKNDTTNSTTNSTMITVIHNNMCARDIILMYVVKKIYR